MDIHQTFRRPQHQIMGSDLLVVRVDGGVDRIHDRLQVRPRRDRHRHAIDAQIGIDGGRRNHRHTGHIGNALQHVNLVGGGVRIHQNIHLQHFADAFQDIDMGEGRRIGALVDRINRAVDQDLLHIVAGIGELGIAPFDAAQCHARSGLHRNPVIADNIIGIGNREIGFDRRQIGRLGQHIGHRILDAELRLDRFELLAELQDFVHRRIGQVQRIGLGDCAHIVGARRQIGCRILEGQREGFGQGVERLGIKQGLINRILNREIHHMGVFLQGQRILGFGLGNARHEIDRQLVDDRQINPALGHRHTGLGCRQAAGRAADHQIGHIVADHRALVIDARARTACHRVPRQGSGQGCNRRIRRRCSGKSIGHLIGCQALARFDRQGLPRNGQREIGCPSRNRLEIDLRQFGRFQLRGFEHKRNGFSGRIDELIGQADGIDRFQRGNLVEIILNRLHRITDIDGEFGGLPCFERLGAQHLVDRRQIGHRILRAQADIDALELADQSRRQSQNLVGCKRSLGIDRKSHRRRLAGCQQVQRIGIIGNLRGGQIQHRGARVIELDARGFAVLHHLLQQIDIIDNRGRQIDNIDRSQTGKRSGVSGRHIGRRIGAGRMVERVNRAGHDRRRQRQIARRIAQIDTQAQAFGAVIGPRLGSELVDSGRHECIGRTRAIDLHTAIGGIAIPDFNSCIGFRRGQSDEPARRPGALRGPRCQRRCCIQIGHHDIGFDRFRIIRSRTEIFADGKGQARCQLAVIGQTIGRCAQCSGCRHRNTGGNSSGLISGKFVGDLFGAVVNPHNIIGIEAAGHTFGDIERIAGHSQTRRIQRRTGQRIGRGHRQAAGRQGDRHGGLRRRSAGRRRGCAAADRLGQRCVIGRQIGVHTTGNGCHRLTSGLRYACYAPTGLAIPVPKTESQPHGHVRQVHPPVKTDQSIDFSIFLTCKTRANPLPSSDHRPPFAPKSPRHPPNQASNRPKPVLRSLTGNFPVRSGLVAAIRLPPAPHDPPPTPVPRTMDVRTSQAKEVRAGLQWQ